MSSDRLYDFLFDHDFPAWLCNASKRPVRSQTGKEFFMKLHTGETQAPATKEWSWEQREKLGQVYLEKLASDFLSATPSELNRSYGADERVDKAKRVIMQHLELDGYRRVHGRLLAPESDVLDTREEQGVLEALYKRLGLANLDTAMHCLKLSEDNWLESHWDDCIANARRFLECTLQETAAAHSRRVKATTLPDSTYSRPARVREYLEREGLIEPQEMKAIREVYGLLSGTGSHPYIAAKDQARLLRQIALIYSQFIMLRLEGCAAPVS